MFTVTAAIYMQFQAISCFLGVILVSGELELPPNSFSILSSFKRHLKETYRDLCVTRFDVSRGHAVSL